MNIVRRATTDLTVPSRDLDLRQGRNDRKVEIVRRGTFYEGFVSQLMPGDAFQFMEGPGSGRWFGVINPVKKLPGSVVFGGNGDTVFQFDGLEIMQAAPTIERRHVLPAPEVDDVPAPVTQKKRPLLPAPDDVEDVDFNE